MSVIVAKRIKSKEGTYEVGRIANEILDWRSIRALVKSCHILLIPDESDDAEAIELLLEGKHPRIILRHLRLLATRHSPNRRVQIMREILAGGKAPVEEVSHASEAEKAEPPTLEEPVDPPTLEEAEEPIEAEAVEEAEEPAEILHLDPAFLEQMKKDELVNLASDMGVSSSGTKKEIIERIAAEEIAAD